VLNVFQRCRQARHLLLNFPQALLKRMHLLQYGFEQA
jgi:hypothetical protein